MSAILWINQRIWNKIYDYYRCQDSFISIYEKKLDDMRSDDTFES
jgi:hypothetical protein